MDQERPNSGGASRNANPTGPQRNLTRYLILILIVLGVAGVCGIVRRFSPPNPTLEPASASGSKDSTQKNASTGPVPVRTRHQEKTVDASPVTPPEITTPTNATGSLPIANPPVAAVAVAPRPEPTPQTRQLVTSLTKIDLQSGAITPERAGQWKESLQQLVQQGAAAVPAIQEFLERNQDLNFTAIKDGNLTGYSSLRAGLFDALQQIGGTEATELMVQTLRSTGDPLEVALLARNLEKQSPGQYRQEALNAALATLQEATQDQPNTRDVSPLFQLLQTYGDASVLAGLQTSLPRWGYYETMALAALPEGAGIPTLIHQVQEPGAANDSTKNFALQMLAQQSAQYPEAGKALVDQARLNQISDYAWRQIGSVLGGDQYQFGSQVVDNTLAPPNAPGVRTYHIESGNQNFYTVPVASGLPADQINQRRALIDQLLGATSNPTALQSLQSARAALSGDQAQK